MSEPGTHFLDLVPPVATVGGGIATALGLLWRLYRYVDRRSGAELRRQDEEIAALRAAEAAERSAHDSTRADLYASQRKVAELQVEAIGQAAAVIRLNQQISGGNGHGPSPVA